jgi:type II secretory pathway pseudopilin PulG
MLRMIRTWLGRLEVTGDEKGLSLVETLVTIAIMGVTLVAFSVALSTGSLAVSESDQEVTAQSLAQSQMEYIKGYPYAPGATTYPTVNTTDNYSISVNVEAISDPDADANIQKVTANISRNGQVLLTVEDYKVNR